MSDMDPMAEAYHMLGALRFQQDQAKQALEEEIRKISETGRDLEKQLQEAEELNDGETVQRITEAIEELHRAYVVAKDELDRHQPEEQDPEEDGDDTDEDQPQDQEDNDDDSGPEEARRTAGDSGAAGSTSAGATQSAGPGDSEPGDQGEPDNRGGGEQAGRGLVERARRRLRAARGESQGEA